MADIYRPRPGSLAARVCAWLKNNPGRRLIGSEICARFGATASNMASQLGAAEDADLLTSELVGRGNVYSAGPALAKWVPEAEDATAAAVAFTKPAAEARPKRVTPKRATCEPEDLVFEDGIPMRSNFGPGAVGKFDATFAAMKVGQSFKRPHAEAKSLRDKADRWSNKHTEGKVTFALRKVDDTHSRVWRTA